MKNIFIVLTVAIIAGLSAKCQSTKVPEVVKKAFAAKYPNATNVKWGKEDATEYEAEFKLNAVAVAANFKADGSWIVTETEMPIADLPAAVSAAIATLHPGAVITLVEKMEKPGAIFLYEVAFKVNRKKNTLDLNAEGIVVK